MHNFFVVIGQNKLECFANGKNFQTSNAFAGTAKSLPKLEYLGKLNILD
jgi:hypothetical protein